MSLELELGVFSDTFAYGASIGARLSLANRSRNPVFINSRLLLSGSNQHELGIVVRSPAGQLPFRQKVLVRQSSHEFQWLRSQHFLGFDLDLTEHFELGPGRYDVWAIYRNRTDPPAGAEAKGVWKGTIKSRPTALTIMP
jgi:hypothetical protein